MKLNKNEIKRLKQRYGDWVLITGSTSGIGKELAIKFGEAGFNLVITGRKIKNLEEIAVTLFDEYKVEAIPIAGDLSNADEVQSLIHETAHLPISIAILNAGYGTSGPFINGDIDTEMNMLDLNCKAVLILAHHFAKQFATKKKGAIMFLSSIVAFQGVPNAAHYAATKAYIQSLGEALAIELKPVGVDILCAAPGPVESGFSERANMMMRNALSPEDVGVPIITKIGKKTTTFPGFQSKLIRYSLGMLPRWIQVKIIGQVMAGFTQHQNN